MKKLRAEYGDYLQNLRTKAGLSQGDVSEKLGYSTPQFISNWERGVSKPPVTVLKQLAKLYNKSAEQMFNEYLEQIHREVASDMKAKFKKAGMI